MHIEKTAELRTADAVRLRGNFGIILIQLFKETFVNCHSALDAESSDFKFRCAAVFNAAGCRVKPGMTRRPYFFVSLITILIQLF